MIRLAILISGRGSNMEALVLKNQQERLFDLRFVASSRSDAQGLARAEQLEIATEILPYNKNSQAGEAELERLWKLHDLDLIVLAGFMRILSPEFTERHEGRILNIHPSLLPLFPGAHAIEDFWKSDHTTSGVTVHLVDQYMDHGPILRQVSLSRRPEETLADFEVRLHQLEHQLYWETLKDYGSALITRNLCHDERSTLQ